MVEVGLGVLAADRRRTALDVGRSILGPRHATVATEPHHQVCADHTQYTVTQKKTIFFCVHLFNA